MDVALELMLPNVRATAAGTDEAMSKCYQGVSASNSHRRHTIIHDTLTSTLSFVVIYGSLWGESEVGVGA